MRDALTDKGQIIVFNIIDNCNHGTWAVCTSLLYSAKATVETVKYKTEEIAI